MLSRACPELSKTHYFECPFVLEGFVKIAYIIKGESLHKRHTIALSFEYRIYARNRLRHFACSLQVVTFTHKENKP